MHPFLTGAAWAGAPEPRRPDELVGRMDVRHALSSHLERLADPVPTPLLVLEGEAGIGKTTLLADLYRRAREGGIGAIWSQGEAIRAISSYAAVRPLVRALLATGTPPAGTPGLLADILQERFDPDPEVEELHPQERLEQRIELIRSWIETVVAARPLLWIIEDAHWVDSASHSIVDALAGAIPGFGVVMTRRPFVGSTPNYRKAPTEEIVLEPMGRNEISQLVALRLGVSSIPESLSGVVQRRAGGNPLFAEEYAGVLLERGEIGVVDGECELRAPVRQLEHATAPPSLERLITSRVDRLDPRDQPTLRAASVLGRRFERWLLKRVSLADDAALDEQIRRLVDAGFFDPVAEDGTLGFRHPAFQEICFELIVTAQKRLLNRRAAEALEEAPEDERERLITRRALHWEQAGENEKALPLLREAADRALQSYANEEAIDLLELVLAARDTSISEDVDLDLARIERDIGLAHASLTRQSEARKHFYRALRACGHPVRAGRQHTLEAMARHTAHRVRRSFTGRGARALQGKERGRALVAAEVIGGLAPVELWLGHGEAYAALAFDSCNLGDLLEPSPVSAGATTALGYLLGMTPLRRFAEPDLRRGLEDATESGDPQLRVMCGVLLGMFLTLNGRAETAIDSLRVASNEGGEPRERTLATPQPVHAGGGATRARRVRGGDGTLRRSRRPGASRRAPRRRLRQCARRPRLPASGSRSGSTGLAFGARWCGRNAPERFEAPALRQSRCAGGELHAEWDGARACSGGGTRGGDTRARRIGHGFLLRRLLRPRGCPRVVDPRARERRRGSRRTRRSGTPPPRPLHQALPRGRAARGATAGPRRARARIDLARSQGLPPRTGGRARLRLGS